MADHLHVGLHGCQRSGNNSHRSPLSPIDLLRSQHTARSRLDLGWNHIPSIYGIRDHCCHYHRNDDPYHCDTYLYLFSDLCDTFLYIRDLYFLQCFIFIFIFIKLILQCLLE